MTAGGPGLGRMTLRRGFADGCLVSGRRDGMHLDAALGAPFGEDVEQLVGGFGSRQKAAQGR
jgi:hypothetical protein